LEYSLPRDHFKKPLVRKKSVTIIRSAVAAGRRSSAAYFCNAAVSSWLNLPAIIVAFGGAAPRGLPGFPFGGVFFGGTINPIAKRETTIYIIVD
jgi:hypothetical protein